jgi:hypothetical protein
MARHGIEVRAGVKPKNTVGKLAAKIRANSQGVCGAYSGDNAGDP